MAELLTIGLANVDNNPLRKLDVYPYSPTKIETLRQSIRDVGLWEGVIGRKHGNRVQIAFGHHRIEAARQELGEKAKVAIILRDLTDEEMLKFMGRENLEDYNADFLIMLETWEAAEGFSARLDAQTSETIEIAKILGWTRKDGDRGTLRAKDIADTCASALSLIRGKYLKRDDLAGLTVKDARELCQHTAKRLQQLDAMARKTARPAAETEHAKKVVGRAAAHTAERVREGTVAKQGIRTAVDVETHTNRTKHRSPLFGQFLIELANGIEKMLCKDSASAKLEEIKKILAANTVEMPEDFQALERLGLELKYLEGRAENWRRAVSDPRKKITNLREAM